jgi:hypothetical protein
MVQEEFSDLADAEEVTRVCVRILDAIAVGGLLRLEREAKGTAAGLRTHMPVALGAALFVLQRGNRHCGRHRHGAYRHSQYIPHTHHPVRAVSTKERTVAPKLIATFASRRWKQLVATVTN